LTYLIIALVMMPIVLPSGVRAIADLLEKEGVEITLKMKIAYIIAMTMCGIGFVPAGIYVGAEWGVYASAFYFIVGYFMLIAPIMGDDKDGVSA
jgi:hypothetical protein